MVSIAVSLLLVEDTPADARIAQEIIYETKCEISLVIARDGLQALSAVKEIFARRTPIVLFFDLRFPHGDGFQALEFIEQYQCTEN